MKTLNKVLVTASIVLLFAVLPLAADSGIKLGVVGGYPVSGLTGGFRLDKAVELNVNVGTDYYGLGASVNGLFNIVDIKIGSEVLPLSVGPEVYLGVGSYFDLGALAIVRWEWTPSFLNFLNFFVEGGAGLEIIDNLHFQWSSKAGIRFVL